LDALSDWKGATAMLGVKTYDRKFVDACRQKIASDVDAIERTSVSAKHDGHSAREIEARLYNNLVIVLDALFVHRLRTVEGKDGNPLNEARIVAWSLIKHDGVLTAETGIKLVPDKSVLKLKVGEPVALTCAQFKALADAFFAELERKFVEN